MSSLDVVNAAKHFTDLAALHGPLHDYLDPSTREKFDGERVSGTNKLHPPIPIRPEVSDLIREVERFAHTTESDVRVTFGYGVAYWTKPKGAAVPESLRWVGSQLAQLDEEWALQLGAAAGVFVRQARHTIVQPGPALLTLHAACPHCSMNSLRRVIYGDHDEHVRCINPVCVDGRGKAHRWSVDQWRNPATRPTPPRQLEITETDLPEPGDVDVCPYCRYTRPCPCQDEARTHTPARATARPGP